MTERFTRDDSFMFSSIKDNGKPLKVSEVVDLLNRQDFAIEVKQKYIEKLEKQLEQIPKSIREVWLE